MRAAQRLQLLGRDDEHPPEIAGAVAVAALLADARLLLGRERRRLAEGEASVLLADALDVAGSVAFEAQERTDVIGALGELGEERMAFGLARSLGGLRLVAPASSEHTTSMRSDAPEGSGLTSLARPPPGPPMVRTRHCPDAPAARSLIASRQLGGLAGEEGLDNRARR